ncbi:hypothetical protein C7974DRAFT_141051 [Boeremia exigua]|uniref:uncharacterized protein n=1 Tax=Boeremia exigua TaxID=749465 RepID=UPI001E8EF355|nr:uncharacterized protein C7974DRAFT_141051 [Boeremia exigua]KAH6637414.1 hypothetical protein C7974DRAFT_141051 [Boeremia exigua]
MISLLIICCVRSCLCCASYDVMMLEGGLGAVRTKATVAAVAVAFQCDTLNHILGGASYYTSILHQRARRPSHHRVSHASLLFLAHSPKPRTFVIADTAPSPDHRSPRPTPSQTFTIAHQYCRKSTQSHTFIIPDPHHPTLPHSM